jgi:hypothetical protein
MAHDTAQSKGEQHTPPWHKKASWTVSKIKTAETWGCEISGFAIYRKTYQGGQNERIFGVVLADIYPELQYPN